MAPTDHSDSPELPASQGEAGLAARLRAWSPTHKLTAARASLERLTTKLRLGALGTGTWRGRDIAGEEIRIDMKADAVAFEKSRVELHVKVELGVQVPSIRSREPKVFKLGPVHESVSTPALPRIDLAGVAREIAASFVLSKVHADEVTADVAPIREVDAGMVGVEGMRLHDAVFPIGGMSLPGVQVGSLRWQGVGLEAGAARGGQVDAVRLSGVASASDVVLQAATIAGGRAMAAEGDDLNLGFEVQLPALTIKTFPAMPAAIERLVTRLSVRIEPKVVFQIGNLRLDGLSLATRVGSLRIGKLSLPVEVTGASFDEVVWEKTRVDDVQVGELAGRNGESGSGGE